MVIFAVNQQNLKSEVKSTEQRGIRVWPSNFCDKPAHHDVLQESPTPSDDINERHTSWVCMWADSRQAGAAPCPSALPWGPARRPPRRTDGWPSAGAPSSVAAMWRITELVRLSPPRCIYSGGNCTGRKKHQIWHGEEKANPKDSQNMQKLKKQKNKNDYLYFSRHGKYSFKKEVKHEWVCVYSIYKLPVKKNHFKYMSDFLFFTTFYTTDKSTSNIWIIVQK